MSFTMLLLNNDTENTRPIVIIIIITVITENYLRFILHSLICHLLIRHKRYAYDL